MADGAPPPEEDFNSIPIFDRLAHKNWKARVSAYEELKTAFKQSASESDPVFKPYINNPDTLKKIATDANAIDQEKGLECLVEFVKFAGENAARTREAVVPALVTRVALWNRRTQNRQRECNHTSKESRRTRYAM